MKSTAKLLIALLCLVHSTNAQVPSGIPIQGMYAWYSFNGNANDLSGNGHDGTVNGATLTTDRFGVPNSAYSYDGVSNNIILQNTVSFNSNAFTFSAWVNFTDNAGDRAVISKHDNFWQNGFSIFATNNHAGIAINNGSSQYVFSPLTYNDSLWHLYVGIYDGINSYIYVDTALVGTVSSPVAPTVNTIDLRFGMDSQLAPFHGIIDDAGIWTRALSQNEITLLYTTTTGIRNLSNKEGLILHFNPELQQLKISLKYISPADPGEIQIFNSSGQLIHSEIIYGSENAISLTSLSNGVYLVNVIYDEQQFSGKFINR